MLLFLSCALYINFLLILCLCSLQNKVTTLLSLFIIINDSQASEFSINALHNPLNTLTFAAWEVQVTY